MQIGEIRVPSNLGKDLSSVFLPQIKEEMFKLFNEEAYLRFLNQIGLTGSTIRLYPVYVLIF